ncbi:hypothetical protein BU24DRAFT_394062 [Aaosphaeria arxii CBS 175.79]|uniref:Something about silencing protein 4 domain-containing protein n=1 Tax=Aaosphaeria arxii CBS 175.79 TaxID=1450172 RepID=A0A6A5XJ96_9PLEO|nr:uncharacterized protein BU24DRAFT_394062 [Aaosphaeria arxii CBS 175.79]KAF2013335.1 hypothetical protein BU24DRAFT_394062 [Aaosphaeria arxii CBS 175.79]
MMATPSRPPPPPLRSSTERRTRLTKSPATDEVENNAHHHDNVTISTRRASRNAPLIALSDDSATRTVSQTPTKPASLAHGAAAAAGSRKRPAAALGSADAPPTETTPPTKVTVTHPHGQLLRLTNGVPQELELRHDDLASGTSTPSSHKAGDALSAPAQSQDKRSLRSHDGGHRLKSDLAIYFSNYDDIIAGIEKPAGESRQGSVSPTRSRKPKPQSPVLQKQSHPALPPSQSSTTYQILDSGSGDNNSSNNNAEDPLADSVFFAQHRRAERKEKQLRNIEKERAMHEKMQLERLLDGLQGPDWLKVMGVTGVTDGERKDWEPKRDYFVKEVEALVDKFRIWKEEEKRLRAEKEAALARQDDEDDEDEDDEEDEDDDDDGTSSSLINPQPPKPRRPPRPHGYFLPLLPPQPTAPFTSFYSKPHLRAAALGKHRHGRNASAFGQPVPDFAELEFGLPEEYLTVEALRDHARKRRRQKRDTAPSKK